MSGTRAIRARIKSIESTKQIVSSMKVIAASRHRRVQALQGSLQSFQEHVEEMFSALLSSAAAENSPCLRAPGKSGKVCYVLIVGNRGMCGVYNMAVLKLLQTVLEEDNREKVLAVCGRWGKEIMSAYGIEADKRFELDDAPTAESTAELTRWLLDAYMAGQFDEINFVYQSFETVLKQSPAVKRLLPIEKGEQSREKDYCIYEPDPDTVRQELQRMYIENSVYSLLLEAKRGEHAARMAAMTAASDNTEELLAKLQLRLNHARQAAITTEISEIVGGAAALEGL